MFDKLTRGVMHSQDEILNTELGLHAHLPHLPFGAFQAEGWDHL